MIGKIRTWRTAKVLCDMLPMGNKRLNWPQPRRPKEEAEARPKMIALGPKSVPHPRQRRKGEKGKGKAHSDKCYFYNVELRKLGSGCRYGADCQRAHTRIPDEAFEPMRMGSQSPRRDRSPSSSDKDQKAAKSGKDRGASR